MQSTLYDKIYGTLLGGIIGDAMGAPVEGKRYEEIEEKYGASGVADFEGVGTDDTAIREQLIWAIRESGGYPTVDHFARSFTEHKARNQKMWFTPVRNAFGKYELGVAAPAYCGWGNMPSSSTAMSFSPMGIINAGNPRQAAMDAFQIATFIHDGPTAGFCRDGAAAMSAAVAAAFLPGATARSVVDAAVEFLLPESAKLIVDLIASARSLAKESGDYRVFRERYYAKYLQALIADSRETIPATLAIVELCGGDPKRTILCGANFGRDADTIGTMAGGVVGALCGASGLPAEWVGKVEANPDVRYREIATELLSVIEKRAAGAASWAQTVSTLAAR